MRKTANNYEKVIIFTVSNSCQEFKNPVYDILNQDFTVDCRQKTLSKVCQKH